MTERVYTRIDSIRRHLDDMLKACADKEVSRSGYVHLYGVGQACALLALRRGHELQHWLRNPLEDYFFEKSRIPGLIEELGFSCL